MPVTSTDEYLRTPHAAHESEAKCFGLLALLAVVFASCDDRTASRDAPTVSAADEEAVLGAVLTYLGSGNVVVVDHTQVEPEWIRWTELEAFGCDDAWMALTRQARESRELCLPYGHESILAVVRAAEFESLLQEEAESPRSAFPGMAGFIEFCVGYSPAMNCASVYVHFSFPFGGQFYDVRKKKAGWQVVSSKPAWVH